MRSGSLACWVLGVVGEMKPSEKVMRMMRQAQSIKSPKHGQLLFGRFQKALAHLSVELRDACNREFRRVARRSSIGTVNNTRR